MCADKNTDIPQMKTFAETKFKLINEAFSVLSDPVKRRQYDLEILTKKANAFYENDNFYTKPASAYATYARTKKYPSEHDARGARKRWDNF